MKRKFIMKTARKLAKPNFGKHFGAIKFKTTMMRLVTRLVKREEKKVFLVTKPFIMIQMKIKLVTAKMTQHSLVIKSSVITIQRVTKWARLITRKAFSVVTEKCMKVNISKVERQKLKVVVDTVEEVADIREVLQVVLL